MWQKIATTQHTQIITKIKMGKRKGKHRKGVRLNIGDLLCPHGGHADEADTRMTENFQLLSIIPSWALNW